MRPVEWSEDALTELEHILDFYAPFDVDYALRLIDQIEAAADRLGIYHTGRPSRVPGYYEKSLPKLSYILVYEFGRDDASPLSIVHVFHSAQDWPNGSWPE